MALVNDHPNEPTYISKPNSSEDSSPENYALYQTDVAYTGGGGGGSDSSSSTMNSDHQHNQGFVFYPSNETIEDHISLMDFNTSLFLSFDHLRSFTPPASVLDGSMSNGYTGWSHNQFDSISPDSFGLSKPATNHENGDYSDPNIVNTGSRHESTSFKPAGNKRPCTGQNTQALKKPCSGTNGKAKPKATTSPKDPQSLAAKVDLVTMLEKAIGYVKFLQVQVKVLAADEFWPAQGGKAPDISQVKEAIDAILSSSQRDRIKKQIAG
ncbi:unnamed protein product [Thlaspi arvense]|uniref:Uncharacterized protein n=1 Tax=Thlaspi arvense TaxID=13288 RepID=A0AAU9T9P0_THLAR|nr:unnamed protein product [Thlaspi arvense]